VSEVELKTAQSEVESLLARRDFLESDVDQLEQFLVDQRDRLRQAASSLIDITERVPGGLGDVRRPLLSASDDPASPLDPRAGADATSEVGPDLAVGSTAEPSLLEDDDGATGDDADRSEPGQSAANEPVGDEQVVTTPSVAEPDDEPQFRFGLGETRRYE
jgi:hypothetical protein